MRNLDFRDYLQIHLPKPSPAEQEAVVEVVRNVADAISAAKHELESATRLSHCIASIFTKGLTGIEAKYLARGNRAL